MVEDQNWELENLWESSGENETISKLSEHDVNRNNTKSAECFKVFFSYTIRQVSSLWISVKDSCENGEV